MSTISIKRTFELIEDKLTESLFEKALTGYGLELERLVVEELDRQGRSVEGDLRKSIGFSVEKTLSKWILKIGAGVRYAPFVELGTRPHTPPFEPILRWVKKRKITGRASTRNRQAFQTQQAAARAIQFHISRKGTKAHPFLSLVFEREKRKMANEIMQRLISLTQSIVPIKGDIS